MLPDGASLIHRNMFSYANTETPATTNGNVPKDTKHRHATPSVGRLCWAKHTALTALGRRSGDFVRASRFTLRLPLWFPRTLAVLCCCVSLCGAVVEVSETHVECDLHASGVEIPGYCKNRLTNRNHCPNKQKELDFDHCKCDGDWITATDAGEYCFKKVTKTEKTPCPKYFLKNNEEQKDAEDEFNERLGAREGTTEAPFWYESSNRDGAYYYCIYPTTTVEPRDAETTGSDDSKKMWVMKPHEGSGQCMNTNNMPQPHVSEDDCNCTWKGYPIYYNTRKSDDASPPPDGGWNAIEFFGRGVEVSYVGPGRRLVPQSPNATSYAKQFQARIERHCRKCGIEPPRFT